MLAMSILEYVIQNHWRHLLGGALVGWGITLMIASYRRYCREQRLLKELWTTRHPAELRYAYTWTCDSCGRDNFTPAVVVESPEQQRKLREEIALPVYLKGSFCQVPYFVRCRCCGDKFAARLTEGTTSA